MGYDLAAVVKEIREAIKQDREGRVGQDRQPGEFTAAEYAEEGKISERSARRDLATGLELGLVTRRKSRTVPNTWWYKRIEKEDANE